MVYRFLPLVLLFLMSFSPKTANNVSSDLVTSKSDYAALAKIEMIYFSLDANHLVLPPMECFKKAMLGYYSLKEKGLIEKEVLTVIDFSLSSTKKRMWVIDLISNRILFNNLVTHGMKSGGEFASSFSNELNSSKSSLGFYITGETYIGKHGLSLKLDGQERGINDNARNRSVVMHGAEYANPAVIKIQGYLGRSQGCPAIPEAIKYDVINAVKDKTCLFIYHPTRAYDIVSKLIT
ncbi:murein L,D-transpeptidase catalytic domain family protein [Flavobacterium davisii]|uniref:murein L,D-transpeptidase catalytic domain family protein n=1 Tax=Flavobacterium davisii TaxID=2906077 RepID=UPI0035D1235D